jgi:hypothetical protein
MNVRLGRTQRLPGNPCTPASPRLSAVRPKVTFRPLRRSRSTGAGLKDWPCERAESARRRTLAEGAGSATNGLCSRDNWISVTHFCLREQRWVGPGDRPSQLALLGTVPRVVCVKSKGGVPSARMTLWTISKKPVFAEGVASGPNRPLRTPCGRNSLGSDRSRDQLRTRQFDQSDVCLAHQEPAVPKRAPNVSVRPNVGGARRPGRSGRLAVQPGALKFYRLRASSH